MKRSRTSTAALCVALLLTAVTTGAAVASGPDDGTPQRPPPREAAALTGSAKLYRSAGDDITLTFDAHLAAEHDDNPLEATGTFEFSHYLDGGGAARAKATVDCLLTGGDVAVVSGVITDSDLPGAEGRRVGVTVHDLGRHDRLGYGWAATAAPWRAGNRPSASGRRPSGR